MRELLTNVCHIQYGFAFDSSKFSGNDGIPLVRIRDVVRGFSETYTTEKCSEDYLVHDGDILIGMDGEFNIAKWQGGNALLNQRVCKLQPIGRVNADYLFYFMSTALKSIEEKTPFVTVKHLSAKELNQVEIPLLPLEQQKKIADILNGVSTMIAVRRQQLAELDTLVKSRFVELFGNIDECENKLELQDICLKITDGSHNPPSGVEKSQNYMISSQNIHDNIIDYKDVRYLSDSDFENENKRTAIMSGDVLLTIVGAIGRSAVVKDDLNITCQRSVCIIHPNRDKVNSIFLKYMLDSISDKIINEARGAAQKGIYLNQVKKLQIICPSFDYQSQFATFVEQTDKSKVVVQKALDEAQLLFDSLMQEYFG